MIECKEMESVSVWIYYPTSEADLSRLGYKEIAIYPKGYQKIIK